MIFPTNLDDLSYHLNNFPKVLAEKAIPSNLTWVFYFFFFALQLFLAGVMPGLVMEGKSKYEYNILINTQFNQ